MCVHFYTTTSQTTGTPAAVPTSSSKPPSFCLRKLIPYSLCSNLLYIFTESGQREKIKKFPP